MLSLSLSPGNSYSLISSWNAPQNLPNMVAGTLCFYQPLIPPHRQGLGVTAGSPEYLSGNLVHDMCAAYIWKGSKVSVLNVIRPPPAQALSSKPQV